MNIRNQLIAAAITHHGKWDDILQAIETKKLPSEEETEALISQVKCKTLTILDADYPDYLRHYYKPPIVLFYYGDISLIKDNNKNIAVVGSREPESIALKNTNKVVSELAKDFGIVSGLAKGIDRQAHESAINTGGKTIAVLGSGIELCYPSCNNDLYEEIKKNHLLISEYFDHETPGQENFPHRNRLIAMFATSTLIPYAKTRSGTSITANYTIAFGHTLFCMPSSHLEDSLCNSLIHDGAILVRSSEDILYELNK